MTGEESSSTLDHSDSTEHEQQSPTAPRVAAALVPEAKSAPENPNIELKQQTQATMEDQAEKRSAFDGDTIHVPLLSPPFKDSLVCLDQSKSAANLNEPEELGNEADTQTPSNPEPSVSPNTTPTNATIETETFVGTSEEPTVDCGPEDNSTTEKNVPGPSGTTVQQNDNSHASRKTQGTALVLQPSRTTFIQQQGSDSNIDNTEEANSDAQVEKFEEAISSPSEIDLLITDITESESNSESSEESVRTIRSKGRSGHHSKGTCSGANNSNEGSKSSSESDTNVTFPTNEPGTNGATRARVVYEPDGTYSQVGDEKHGFSSDCDSLKNAKQSKKFGALSTKEALARMFRTPSRRNAIIVVRNAMCNDLGIISRILSHRAKKMLQIVTKIAGVVKEVLVKLSYSPLKMIEVMQALLSTDIANRVLAKFKWTSEAVRKIVVCIVEYVVRVLHSLYQLLRRRVIPGTRIVAAKTYCAATSLFLFWM